MTGNDIETARASSCIGKFRHNSKGDADKQARQKPFLSSYRCNFCGFWHVGHDAPASMKEHWRKRARRIKKAIGQRQPQSIEDAE